MSSAENFTQSAKVLICFQTWKSIKACKKISSMEILL